MIRVDHIISKLAGWYKLTDGTWALLLWRGKPVRMTFIRRTKKPDDFYMRRRAPKSDIEKLTGHLDDPDPIQSTEKNTMKLRAWHIPQVPMESFHVAVPDVETAKLVLQALAEYDLFQYKKNVKPDYSNAQGLEIFDGDEWIEWHDDDNRDISEVMDEDDEDLSETG